LERKWSEVRGRWKEFHSEELNYLYQIKKLTWVGIVGVRGEMRNVYKI
jgi:hypothetical protein